MHLLILGGSGFIGPHYVHAAVQRGHRVAVFNRGKASAELPGSVERLVGDRSTNLEAIEHREWDAVIDLATYAPGWVRTLGEALGVRIGHYTFISTMHVYDRSVDSGRTDERSPLLTYHGDQDPYGRINCGNDYG